MARTAWIVGTHSTPFRKWPDRDFRQLTELATVGALDDAAIDGARVDQVWFGNCAMGTWGQANIRGQVALGALQRAGTVCADAAVVNVECGCATGSAALSGAVRDVLAGADVSLAVGVEKTFVPDDPAATFGLFAGGIDQLYPDEWRTFLAEQAQAADLSFAPHPQRVLFLDVHALAATAHMRRHGTTVAQLAAIASKDHHHGSLNEKAQYRFEIDVQGVLDDRAIVAPFTRSMCCPISDGAAAAVVVSDAVLQTLDARTRERAVRVRSCELVAGTWRGIDSPNVAFRAAERSYARAGITGAQVQVAEVHDATSFCELQATEALGLCAVGEGGAFAVSGATSLGGERPVNLSGGLVSKGHPLAATGLGMIDELVLQLRGEAGARQAVGATLGVAQNAGGQIGLDEAVCAVTVLERT